MWGTAEPGLSGLGCRQAAAGAEETSLQELGDGGAEGGEESGLPRAVALGQQAGQPVVPEVALSCEPPARVGLGLGGW